MLEILSGTYGDNVQAVYDSLMRQLQEGRDQTWREQKDQEFGLR
jgi:hypothetical protein